MSKLKELRVKNNLTQQELADISGVKLATEQKLEGGYNNINNANLGTAIKLARALGVTAEELYEEE